MGEHIVEPKAYDYERMRRDLRRLRQRYCWLQEETIGCSVLGRQLTCVKLGEGERRLHVNAAFHANEWVTSLVLMRLLEQMSDAYTNNAMWYGRSMRQLLKDNTLWLAPMVNPDGVELVLHGTDAGHPFHDQLLTWNGGSSDFTGWKANIRGVDLNDQFPACWETERERRVTPGPGPRDYTGEAPLTEPEAVAIAAHTLDKEFDAVMALHTQGQEIYWNYRDCEPPEAEPLAERLAAVSGYRAVKLTDSDAGYKDWYIQRFRRPGFTVELGLGVNPLPLTQLPQMQLEAGAMLAELLSV